MQRSTITQPVSFVSSLSTARGMEPWQKWKHYSHLYLATMHS